MKQMYVIFVALITAFIASAQIPPELQNLSYGIYPTDPISYNEARFNYNKRFNVFPLAIFVPTTEAEMQFTFTTLTSYNLPFAIRSGGHCYEPGSLSSSYIISLAGFSTITPDVSTETVQIGAGVLLSTLTQTVGALDYAVPVGTCPTNCISGFTLGGGLGLLQRMYGIACDSVISIRLMIANGDIIDVTEQSNPDLFWALRGGGLGSFGIALGFTYNMYYVPAVSFYNLAFEWDPNTLGSIFEAWENWALTLPNEISTICDMSLKAGNTTFSIYGIKVGSIPFTEWQTAFAPFNPTVSIYQGTYLGSTQFWSAQSSLPFVKVQSKMMMQPLSPQVIPIIANHLQKLSTVQPSIEVLFEFEALGGVVPQSTSSFFAKNAFGWWYQETNWNLQEQTEPLLAEIRAFYSKISPYMSVYSYPNTADYDLGVYYLNAYYGSNVNRLIQVKNEVDPGNIFNWAQSIPLAGPIPGSLIAQ